VRKPTAGSAGVDGVLVVTSSPVASSSATTSVKVPPVSMPIRMRGRDRSCRACGHSSRAPGQGSAARPANTACPPWSTGVRRVGTREGVAFRRRSSRAHCEPALLMKGRRTSHRRCRCCRRPPWCPAGSPRSGPGRSSVECAFGSSAAAARSRGPVGDYGRRGATGHVLDEGLPVGVDGATHRGRTGRRSDGHARSASGHGEVVVARNSDVRPLELSLVRHRQRPVHVVKPRWPHHQ
jgi:hypothetical protein